MPLPQCLPSSSSTWPSKDGSVPSQAIALGLGSLFNHSTLHQNIGWKRSIDSECLTYTALRDIEIGEELCISYGGPGVLWFEDADAEEVAEVERQQQDEKAAMNGLGELSRSGLGDIDLEDSSDALEAGHIPPREN